MHQKLTFHQFQPMKFSIRLDSSPLLVTFFAECDKQFFQYFTQTAMDTKYYLLQKNKVVFDNNCNFPEPVTRHDLEVLTGDISLLRIPDVPIEAGALAAELPGSFVLPDNYTAQTLRSLVGKTNDRDFLKWGKASQILHWFKSNRYCGSCGKETIRHPSDLARLCPNCDAAYYPAVSPCIIVLVYRNSEILLARSPRFPQKMYSTLAGFIESGESAEQTIHREIHEEVSVKVKNIRYFGSQPWPFPSQLMLGFFAEYESGTIKVDGDEICDAGWYRADSLPEIPGPATIAGQLIRSHLNVTGIE